jgi:hypothetical protein
VDHFSEDNHDPASKQEISKGGQGGTDPDEGNQDQTADSYLQKGVETKWHKSRLQYTV